MKLADKKKIDCNGETHEKTKHRDVELAISQLEFTWN